MPRGYKGNTRKPRMPTLVTVAKALDTSVEYPLKGGDAPPSPFATSRNKSLDTPLIEQIAALAERVTGSKPSTITMTWATTARPGT